MRYPWQEKSETLNMCTYAHKQYDASVRKKSEQITQNTNLTPD